MYTDWGGGFYPAYSSMPNGGFHSWFFTHHLNSITITFHYDPIPAVPITKIFCTCHDSCAVVACAKFCSDTFVTFRMTSKMKLISNLNNAWKMDGEMIHGATPATMGCHGNTEASWFTHGSRHRITEVGIQYTISQSQKLASNTLFLILSLKFNIFWFTKI